MTTIASFNVNGVRAINCKDKSGEKGGCVIDSLVSEQDIDILCLQEIKASKNPIADLEQYRSRFPWIYARNPITKKGYSGVAILSRRKPLMVTEPRIGSPADDEGRIMCAEFDDMIVVNCYTPNTKSDLSRLEERLEWDALFSEYLQRLRQVKRKPLVVVGDLNCAHQHIDIHNPTRQEKARPAGFTAEERESFTCLLQEVSLMDTYREMNPAGTKYSWWSTITRSREKNAGWRIDYILVTPDLRERIVAADILNEYYGSDHCPVLLRLTAPTL